MGKKEGKQRRKEEEIIDAQYPLLRSFLQDFMIWLDGLDHGFQRDSLAKPTLFSWVCACITTTITTTGE